MKKTKSCLKTCISFALAILSIFSLLSFYGCSNDKDENTVYIATSAEDFRIEDLKKRLKEEFPEYNCIIEYKDTGSLAAKLKTEGKNTNTDIVFSHEYSYLSQLASEGLLADISQYDTAKYAKEIVTSKYFLPEVRNGGAIILNPEVLKKNGLNPPKSYEDLLKPEYKNLISMPNPKSSGTGYMFLRTLTNIMGEEEAFAYFDKLSENVLAFTSSGSGPVNALKNKEVAIGLGMTAQAVNSINEGVNLEIMFFEEGSPFSMYGQAIMSGKETRKPVKDVFDFLINTYTRETNEKFFPEQIFVDFSPVIKNYPQNIKYSDMKNDTIEEKERLLKKWVH